MLKEIGRGGFGVVFEARDRDLGRSVAFKAVRPGARSRQLDAMLLREAESAAHLQHENIVSIFDYGQGELGRTSSSSSCGARRWRPAWRAGR